MTTITASAGVIASDPALSLGDVASAFNWMLGLPGSPAH